MSDADNKSLKSEEKEEKMDTDTDKNDASLNNNDKESPKKVVKADVPQKATPAKSETPQKAASAKAETPQKAATPAKKRKKEETTEDEDDEDVDVVDDDGKKPLFDQPLEVSGSRERKKVERLSVSQTPKDKKLEITVGCGLKLGDCPRIEHNIGKFKAEDLKTMHRILFGKVGSANEIKKHIRLFSGFAFDATSPEHDKKKAVLTKLFLADLKKICEVLDLERGGAKEAIVERLLDFLMAPTDSGKKVPKPKTKSGKRKSSSGKSKEKKAKPAKKSKSKSSDKSEEDDNSGVDDSEDDSEGKKSGSEEDSEQEKDGQSESDKDDDWDKKKSSKKTSKPAPKAKKAPAKKKPSAKKSKKVDESDEDSADEEEEAAPKAETSSGKKPPAKKSKNDVESDVDSDETDDEPLLKKKKSKSPPTNMEIKTLIREILDGANLEEITMKTVCRQVYAAYPDFDLSDRKTFIKNTVRSLIS